MFISQCNCYVACLTCLKLVKPKYHWIVVPIEQDTSKKSNGIDPFVLLHENVYNIFVL